MIFLFKVTFKNNKHKKCFIFTPISAKFCRLEYENKIIGVNDETGCDFIVIIYSKLDF